ncbi:receptor-type tyrosine-protein phosphatase S-like isoform X3 [Ruditapes philippinarum]|uniref:receptor-type tyrosine-protein phosphatase S-like isoform X3 n=1 Tax=Ruditapes philippinarum TaxID=129788 RepID=UPI00295BC311|nr:receptor-type tyrosine-protein phosphatase S-like isoform X3 [Ruditapes philippinarum]
MYEVNVINNVRDPNNNHMISNNFTSPAAVIEPLNPYNNYTVKVRAYTSVGPGEFSEVIQFSTQADEPKKPNNISTISNNSTTLLVMWETPNEFTGPTSYIATANDQISLNSSNCTTYGFNANQCLIKDLKAYTNYTVKVITKTGVWEAVSDSKTGRTDQSTPGQVTNLTLIPEDDVTKPRSLQVTWNEPLERNGILLAYYVLGTYMNDSRVVYRNRTDDSASSYIFQNISTGVYSVQVFAETIKGNGSSVTNTTIVQAGAPIKVIDETNGVLLMQPSNEQPPDKERQIAVQLPLNTFLCDNSNGDLKRWGVIVAQEGQANDKAFVGSLEDFEKKESQYKNWFNIKDMESIPPYIATPKGWKANCPNVNESNRRKRAISHSPTDAQFIVGDHGQCSGVKQDEYCNGQLQPGRSYRVKSFVCTDGGCTETEYSEPLSTVQRKLQDPDLTIPIAAGIASAVVVIAIVALTIFVLRRKQAACFSKDDESLTTHTPGEGIHLDKIEHTKKNHFRQGPVKLTDFPDAVERFHRDSDLLFADAYKMLKEKSPNHLMTAAEQQCCRPKNRYTNILPFDHSRVKLRPSDDIEGSDYINANYIPGYTSRREYIATQGPMQATFDDFWRMVWEQNVDTIVMLTKLMEKGRHKCDKYWPDLGEPVFYGDLVVSLQSESNLSDYTIMIFEIKMKEERKMVRHFSYLKWPDMGCPETPELLLEFVKAVKQYGNQVKNKPSTGPTIVHCSAGVGRTGTFIAVDYLLQHIRDHDEVDIFNLVLDMRNHRLNMVQTEDQYIYIHECLKAFITTDEEEEDEEEEAVYVNTGFGADEENIYVNA